MISLQLFKHTFTQTVIPVQTGIQKTPIKAMDSRLRGNDEKGNGLLFYDVFIHIPSTLFESLPLRGRWHYANGVMTVGEKRPLTAP